MIYIDAKSRKNEEKHYLFSIIKKLFVYTFWFELSKVFWSNQKKKTFLLLNFIVIDSNKKDLVSRNKFYKCYDNCKSTVADRFELKMQCERCNGCSRNCYINNYYIANII